MTGYGAGFRHAGLDPIRLVRMVNESDRLWRRRVAGQSSSPARRARGGRGVTGRCRVSHCIWFTIQTSWTGSRSGGAGASGNPIRLVRMVNESDRLDADFRHAGLDPLRLVRMVNESDRLRPR